ncbi:MULTISPECIES: hypothetical protein [Virgibacillus]|uniref:Phr family secreted Rap phosphatase inhibitor n=1 Tax=Virgibacillus chiguensis TaxID=411959 RepID=A0A1M5LB84_9BACI|nr:MULTISPECIES: hypothetical protein [Virgibacillus]SHG61979.1 hypothetical protein SAMN05421807_10162 [Virgibacillus chiguensis]
MKKIVLKLVCGTFLIGGLVFLNVQYDQTATLQPNPTFNPIEVENV